jgi:hypothetical protein
VEDLEAVLEQFREIRADVAPNENELITPGLMAKQPLNFIVSAVSQRGERKRSGDLL